MDSTPPSRKSNSAQLPKSASRLPRLLADADFDEENIPHFSVNFAASPPKSKTPSSAPSTRKSTACLPLQELLLLSLSPVRKSKTRLSDRLEMADDPTYDPAGSRRRPKGRASSIQTGCAASPRNNRRSRRRHEVEIREDRDSGFLDDVIKPRKRRSSGNSKKDKLTLAPSSMVIIEKIDGFQNGFDGVGELINDLIMWKDVARSSFWFGLGCVCFLSSCFTTGINISLFTIVSQLGLVALGVSFFSTAMHQRDNAETEREYSLTEDHILRVGRVLLPALNLVVSKTRELFSGEPYMTLKVALFLLIGAEYGHLLTLRRVLAIGFFGSFTAPKVYSLYSAQLDQAAKYWKLRVLEAWQACSHKKILAASAATAFWNLTTLKTRIFAAFISLVILRYCRQYSNENLDQQEAVALGQEEDQLQQALVTTDVQPK